MQVKVIKVSRIIQEEEEEMSVFFSVQMNES